MNKCGRVLLLALWMARPVWAMNFDGSNDYVQVADAASLNTTNLSLGAWIYVEAAGEQSIIDKRGEGGVACSGGGDESGYQLRVEDAAFPMTLKLVIKNICLEGTLTWDGIAQNTWTHVAATFDNTSNAMLLYADGVQVASGSTLVDPVANGNDDRLIIGDHEAYAATPPTAQNFDGQIEEPFYSSSVLSAATIALIGGSRVKRMPLQATVQLYLPMDECADAATCSGAGQFQDLSGNGNSGTAIGSPIGAGTVLTYQ